MKEKKKISLYPILANILREKRLSAEITKYRLQKCTGIRRDTIAAIESGKGVKSETLLQYLLFWKSHGIDVIGEMYKILDESEAAKKSINALIDEEVKKKNTPSLINVVFDDIEENDDDFNFALYDFENGKKLGEEEQKSMIRHKLCPCCGSEVAKNKKKGYIGHVKYRADCRYYAYGEITDPVILRIYKEGVTPIAGAKNQVDLD